MKALAAQVEKEWSSFRRDRLGMSLAILLPLATLLLFGYGVRLQNNDIPTSIEDRDLSSVSRKLIDQLHELKVLNLRTLKPGVDVSDQLVDNDVKCAIVLPKGFSENLENGDESQFQVIVDGSDVSSAETVSALVQKASFELEHKIRPIDKQSFFVIPDFHILFNPDVQETPFVVSGVFAIVLWMYPALLAAVAVSRELEQKTIVQVYASGLTGSQFLIGKGMVYFLVGILVSAAMLVLSHFIFGLRLAGDFSTLCVATLTYVAAAVSFGLFVGVMTREENIAVQATATGGFFPALLLSGFVYPLSNIPFPLSLVSYVVPARYYIDVCRDAYLRGTGWEEMWWRILIIAGFGLLLYFGAWNSIKQMRMED